MVNGFYHNVNTVIFLEREIIGNSYSFIYFLLPYNVIIKTEHVNNIILSCLQCNSNKAFIMYSKIGGLPDYVFLFL